jgi:phosphatidylserine/phosphatidylglycerophosphate/cardiolipin synthase-like enzyme
VIEPLIELAPNLRERLIEALRSEILSAPYTEPGVSNAIGVADGAGELANALASLEARGLGADAVIFALGLAKQAVADVPRPDLVWSGAEIKGLHARDTRQVFEELIGAAQKSLWISTFTYFDGPKAFKQLAARLDAVPALNATLLLNIQRKPGDTTEGEALVNAFADRLWSKDWPGERRPDVFYDPRSVDLNKKATAVLHAKAVVADEEVAFVTSANLTEAAFDHNIEAGIVSRDRTLAAALARHFRVLIERQLLLALPAS